jgi:hypothetical protein
MASHKTIKKAPASRYTLLGRERAEHAARLDAGTDSSLQDAASDLLCAVAQYPGILAEGWAEEHGERGPVAALVEYETGFLSRLCELAPQAEA